MTLELDKALSVGLRAVQDACAVTAAVQQTLVTAETLLKKDNSPVTTADFASQIIVSHFLFQAFRDVELIGEESGEELAKPENAPMVDSIYTFLREKVPTLPKKSIPASLNKRKAGAGGMTWVLDPVDGTKGFLRGEQYAVALALMHEGRLMAGFLGCPNYPLAGAGKGCLFYAVRGGGAHRLHLPTGVRSRIAVQSTDDPAEGNFVTNVESGHSDHGRQAAIRKVLGLPGPEVKMDGQGKYGAVACGDGTVYLRLPNPATPDRRENIWDHAAGVMIVEEAGGKVTDAEGKALDFSRGATLSENRGIIATNGRVHDKVVAAVN